MAEVDQIRQVLTWIGFNDNNERDDIINDAMTTYDDILCLTIKDITALASDFGNRTQANGRVCFGSRRTKKLQSVSFWVKDFYRISLVPTTVGLNRASFEVALTRARAREEVRLQMISQSDVKSKAASPGPLVSESTWTEWEPKFNNYLSVIMGINGVPLSYVIRENDNPDRVGPHADFVDETIACTPLAGEPYEADRSTVQQYLVSFTTGEMSEEWIKPLLKKKNGRLSMIALRNHFAGEGNATRRIAVAETLEVSLHYKNERSLPFEVFLTKCQKMFTIYSDEGEERDEKAKIRFLFKAVASSPLSASVEALKAQIATSPTPISYTTVANHLATSVADLPDNVAGRRNISSLVSDGTKGIYKADGSINTGHIINWHQLSDEDKKTVTDERSRQGFGRGGGRGRGGRGRGRGGRGRGGRTGDSIYKLTKANAKYKRKIAALKQKSDATGGEDMDISADDGEGTNDDAGNSFGGKASKKSKK